MPDHIIDADGEVIADESDGLQNLTASTGNGTPTEVTDVDDNDISASSLPTEFLTVLGGIIADPIDGAISAALSEYDGTTVIDSDPDDDETGLSGTDSIANGEYTIGQDINGNGTIDVGETYTFTASGSTLQNLIDAINDNSSDTLALADAVLIGGDLIITSTNGEALTLTGFEAIDDDLADGKYAGDTDTYMITVDGDGEIDPLTFATDPSGTEIPTDPGTASALEGAVTGLTTTDGTEIRMYLADYVDGDGEAGTSIVIGREWIDDGSGSFTTGDVVFAIYLDQQYDENGDIVARIWTVQYDTFAHNDPSDPDEWENVWLSEKLYLLASTELSFDAANSPSGQNLDIMFRKENATLYDNGDGIQRVDLGIIATGKYPANQSDGESITTGDTVNTSQAGGPTTFGVNNQMLTSSSTPGEGEGIFFTFAMGLVDDYTTPNLDQNEADIEHNIDHDGLFSAETAQFTVVQLQGGKTAVVKITAFMSQFDDPTVHDQDNYVDAQLIDVYAHESFVLTSDVDGDDPVDLSRTGALTPGDVFTIGKDLDASSVIEPDETFTFTAGAGDTHGDLIAAINDDSLNLAFATILDGDFLIASTDGAEIVLTGFSVIGTGGDLAEGASYSASTFDYDPTVDVLAAKVTRVIEGKGKNPDTKLVIEPDTSSNASVDTSLPAHLTGLADTAYYYGEVTVENDVELDPPTEFQDLIFIEHADGSYTIYGTKAGDIIEYTSDIDHNRVLIENFGDDSGQDSAEFDIGEFKITDTESGALDVGELIKWEDDSIAADSTAIEISAKVYEDALDSSLPTTTEIEDDNGASDSSTGNIAGTKDADGTGDYTATPGEDDEASGADMSGSDLADLFTAAADQPVTITLSTDTSGLAIFFSKGAQLVYEVDTSEDDYDTLTASVVGVSGEVNQIAPDANEVLASGVYTFEVDANGDGAIVAGEMFSFPADGSTGLLQDLIDAINGSGLATAALADGDLVLESISGEPIMLTGGFEDISNAMAASSRTVFTLTAYLDGSWTFDLDGQLDHFLASGDFSTDLQYVAKVIGADLTTFPAPFTATLEINDVVITGLGSVASAQDVVDAINDNATDPGVTASLDGGVLILTADDINSSIKIEGTDLEQLGLSEDTFAPIFDAIDLSSILVATEGDGDSKVGAGTGKFFIRVENDVPEQNTATVTVAVQEDALDTVTQSATIEGSLGNIDASGTDTTTVAITEEQLATLVDVGADEPASFSLNLDAIAGSEITGTAVTRTGDDENPNEPLTSKGDAVYFLVNDAGTEIWGVTTGDGAPDEDADIDRIVFKITSIADDGATSDTEAFQFELLDQIDNDDDDDLATGEGETDVDTIDIAGAFVATDEDGDALVLDDGLEVDIENDVPEQNTATVTVAVQEDALDTVTQSATIEGSLGNIDASGTDTTTVAITEEQLATLVDVGADEPASFSLNLDAIAGSEITGTAVTRTGDDENPNEPLTSKGDAVYFLVNDAGTEIWGVTTGDGAPDEDADIDRIVFKITSIADDGATSDTEAFQFELLDQIDNDDDDDLATGEGETDVDTIDIAGAFVATDEDGDALVLDDGLEVDIENDVPEQNTATVTVAVQEDALDTVTQSATIEGSLGNIDASGTDTTTVAITEEQLATLVDVGADEPASFSLNLDAIAGSEITGTAVTRTGDDENPNEPLTSKGDAVYFLVNDAGTEIWGVTTGDGAPDEDADIDRIVFKITSIADDGATSDTEAFQFELLDQIDNDDDDDLATGEGETDVDTIDIAGAFVATDEDGDALVLDDGLEVDIENDVPEQNTATVTVAVQEDALDTVTQSATIEGSLGNIDASGTDTTTVAITEEQLATLVDVGADEPASFSLNLDAIAGSEITGTAVTRTGDDENPNEPLTSKGDAVYFLVNDAGTEIWGVTTGDGAPDEDADIDRIVFKITSIADDGATSDTEAFQFELLDQIDNDDDDDLATGEGETDVDTIDIAGAFVATDEDGDALVLDDGLEVDIENDVPEQNTATVTVAVQEDALDTVTQSATIEGSLGNIDASGTDTTTVAITEEQLATLVDVGADEPASFSLNLDAIAGSEITGTAVTRTGDDENPNEPLTSKGDAVYFLVNDAGTEIWGVTTGDGAPDEDADIDRIVFKITSIADDGATSDTEAFQFELLDQIDNDDDDDLATGEGETDVDTIDIAGAFVATDEDGDALVLDDGLEVDIENDVPEQNTATVTVAVQEDALDTVTQSATIEGSLGNIDASGTDTTTVAITEEQLATLVDVGADEPASFSLNLDAIAGSEITGTAVTRTGDDENPNEPLTSKGDAVYFLVNDAGTEIWGVTTGDGAPDEDADIDRIVFKITSIADDGATSDTEAFQFELLDQIDNDDDDDLATGEGETDVDTIDIAGAFVATDEDGDALVLDDGLEVDIENDVPEQNTATVTVAVQEDALDTVTQSATIEGSLGNIDASGTDTTTVAITEEQLATLVDVGADEPASFSLNLDAIAGSEITGTAVTRTGDDENPNEPLTSKGDAVYFLVNDAGTEIWGVTTGDGAPDEDADIDRIVFKITSIADDGATSDTEAFQFELLDQIDNDDDDDLATGEGETDVDTIDIAGAFVATDEDGDALVLDDGLEVDIENDVPEQNTATVTVAVQEDALDTVTQSATIEGSLGNIDASGTDTTTVAITEEQLATLVDVGADEPASFSLNLDAIAGSEITGTAVTRTGDDENPNEPLTSKGDAVYFLVNDAGTEIWGVTTGDGAPDEDADIDRIVFKITSIADDGATSDTEAFQFELLDQIDNDDDDDLATGEGETDVDTIDIAGAFVATDEDGDALVLDDGLEVDIENDVPEQNTATVTVAVQEDALDTVTQSATIEGSLGNIDASGTDTTTVAITEEQLATLVDVGADEPASFSLNLDAIAGSEITGTAVTRTGDDENPNEPLTSKGDAVYFLVNDAGTEIWGVTTGDGAPDEDADIDRIVFKITSIADDGATSDTEAFQFELLDQIDNDDDDDLATGEGETDVDTIDIAGAFVATDEDGDALVLDDGLEVDIENDVPEQNTATVTVAVQEDALDTVTQSATIEGSLGNIDASGTDTTTVAITEEQLATLVDVGADEPASFSLNLDAIAGSEITGTAVTRTGDDENPNEPLTSKGDAVYFLVNDAGTEIWGVTTGDGAPDEDADIDRIVFKITSIADDGATSDTEAFQFELLDQIDNDDDDDLATGEGETDVDTIDIAGAFVATDEDGDALVLDDGLEVDIENDVPEQNTATVTVAVQEDALDTVTQSATIEGSLGNIDASGTDTTTVAITEEQLATLVDVGADEPASFSLNLDAIAGSEITGTAVTRTGDDENPNEPLTSKGDAVYFLVNDAGTEIWGVTTGDGAPDEDADIDRIVFKITSIADDGATSDTEAFQFELLDQIDNDDDDDLATGEGETDVDTIDIAGAFVATDEDGDALVLDDGLEVDIENDVPEQNTATVTVAVQEDALDTVTQSATIEGSLGNIDASGTDTTTVAITEEQLATLVDVGADEPASFSLNLDAIAGSEITGTAVTRTGDDENPNEPLTSKGDAVYFLVNDAGTEIWGVTTGDGAPDEDADIDRIVFKITSIADDGATSDTEAFQFELLDQIDNDDDDDLATGEGETDVDTIDIAGAFVATDEDGDALVLDDGLEVDIENDVPEQNTATVTVAVQEDALDTVTQSATIEGSLGNIDASGTDTTTVAITEEQLATLVDVGADEPASFSLNLDAIAGSEITGTAVTRTGDDENPNEPLTSKGDAVYFLVNDAGTEIWGVTTGDGAPDEDADIDRIVFKITSIADDGATSDTEAFQFELLDQIDNDDDDDLATGEGETDVDTIDIAGAFVATDEDGDALVLDDGLEVDIENDVPEQNTATVTVAVQEDALDTVTQSATIEGSLGNIDASGTDTTTVAITEEQLATLVDVGADEPASFSLNLDAIAGSEITGTAVTRTGDDENPNEPLTSKGDAVYFLVNDAGTEIWGVTTGDGAPDEDADIDRIVFKITSIADDGATSDTEAFQFELLDQIDNDDDDDLATGEGETDVDTIDIAGAFVATDEDGDALVLDDGLEVDIENDVPEQNTATVTVAVQEDALDTVTQSATIEGSLGNIDASGTDTTTVAITEEQLATLVDVGADEPASFSLNLDAIAGSEITGTAVTRTGDDENPNEPLTSKGDAVYFLVNDAGTEIWGVTTGDGAPDEDADIDRIVFKITSIADDGATSDTEAFQFELLDQIDNDDDDDLATGEGETDVDTIDIAGAFVATDEDGDALVLDDGLEVDIENDVPEQNTATVTVAVQEDALDTVTQSATIEGSLGNIDASGTDTTTVAITEEQLATLVDVGADEPASFSLNLDAIAGSEITGTAVTRTGDDENPNEPLTSKGDAVYFLVNDAGTEIWGVTTGDGAPDEDADIDRIVFKITSIADDGATSDTEAFQFELLDQIDNDDDDDLATGEGETDVDTIDIAGAFVATDEDGDALVLDDGLEVDIENDVPEQNTATVTVAVQEDALDTVTQSATIEGSLGNIDASGTDTTTVAITEEQLATLVDVGADEPASFSLNLDAIAGSEITGTAVTRTGDDENPNEPLTSKGDAVYFLVNDAGTEIWGVTTGDGAPDEDADIDRIVFKITSIADDGATSDTEAFQFELLDQIDNDDDDDLATGEGETDVDTIDIAGAFVATDEDGDALVLDDGLEVDIENDVPIIAAHNLFGSGTENPQFGLWDLDIGADEFGSLSIDLTSFTIGEDVFDVNPDETLTLSVVDGKFVFEGTLDDGDTSTDDFDFTLEFREDGTYVFDLDAGFASSVSLLSTEGQLPPGGPDPVQTIVFPSQPADEDEIVFFAVTNATTSDTLIDGALVKHEFVPGDSGDSLEIRAGDAVDGALVGFTESFITFSREMNVSTSGIGVNNNNLNGNSIADIQDVDQSFVVNPELGLTKLRVFIDNSVGGYDPESEELYYRVYEEGATDSLGNVLVDGLVGGVELFDADLLDPADYPGINLNNMVYFEINWDGSDFIDAVQFTMAEGTIKIPFMEFIQNKPVVADPITIELEATYTDFDGDPDSDTFTIQLNTDETPLDDTDADIQFDGNNAEIETFNIDLTTANDSWEITDFGDGDKVVLLNSQHDYVLSNVTELAGSDPDALITVNGVTIDINYDAASSFTDTGDANEMSDDDIMVAYDGLWITGSVYFGEDGGNAVGGADSDAFVFDNSGDSFTGGDGADASVFFDAFAAANVISDFNSAQGDIIVISASTFNAAIGSDALKEGMLTDANFFDPVGDGGVQGATDYFVYNANTCALLFDADGDGIDPAVQFATLSNMPDLDADDIVVIA